MFQNLEKLSDVRESEGKGGKNCRLSLVPKYLFFETDYMGLILLTRRMHMEVNCELEDIPKNSLYLEKYAYTPIKIIEICN